LSVWIAWFFLARVAEYKVAGTAFLEQRPCVIGCGPGLPSNVQAVAEFPASIALAHIRPGSSRICISTDCRARLFNRHPRSGRQRRDGSEGRQDPRRIHH
jgi:hypothetical protein